MAKTGARNPGELKMLAEGLDALASGNLPKLGDVLMGRFQAIETAVQDGDWATAQYLDPANASRISLASLDDRLAASKRALQEAKLTAVREKARKG